MTNRADDKCTIVVAGHLVDDEITLPDGNITAAFGGLTYNIAALCTKMKKGKLLPVCRIGENRKEDFLTIFNRFPAFDYSLIEFTELPNVVNRLVYRDDGNRDEWNSRTPEPLELDSIPSDTDGVLINFISGKDFTPEQLGEFRARFNGLIYMDFHSLSLGKKPDGMRYYRQHPRWKDYIAYCDFLQLNQYELQTITGNVSNQPHPIADDCSILHKSGPSIVIVTLGKEGVVFSEDEIGRRFLIKPKAVKEIDATGCGDTLAAVTLHDYLGGKAVLESVIEGVRWAATKATFSGLDGFATIEQSAVLLDFPEIMELA